MGCGTGPGDSTRDTVAMDTSAARATSSIIATRKLILIPELNGELRSERLARFD